MKYESIIEKIYNNKQLIEVKEYESFIKLSKEHQLIGYIYNYIDKKSDYGNELRNYYLNLNYRLRAQFLVTTKIINAFKNNVQEYVFLKGMYLSELYLPNQIRMMNDIDILVSIEEYTQAEKMLLSCGVKLTEENKHNKYIIDNVNIELHKSVLDVNFISITGIDEDLLKSRTIVNINKVPFNYPSPQEHFNYMILHMITHLMNASFGLKQVIDLVNVYAHETISLNRSYEYFEKNNLVKAFLYVLNSCYYLLEMKIPDEYILKDINDIRYLEQLIDIILKSGAYGHSESNSNIDYYQNKFFTNIWRNTPKNKLHKFTKIVFPSHKDMTDHYSYVRKYRFLLLVGWGHRLVRLIVRKDIDYRFKLFILFSDKKKAKSKEELLKSMQLI